MMKLRIMLGCVVLAVSAGAVEYARAQLPIPGHSACCAHCQLPPQTCTCTTFQPVVETRYRQQNVVSYQDVTRVGYRQEAHCETVPVTTHHQVTVDEGNYQMVWVPKPVTKTVAQTVLQQRVGYRNVPYQYTERVQQVTPTVVAEKSVRYVPRTTQMVFQPQPVAVQATACLQCVPPVAGAIGQPYTATAPMPLSMPTTALQQPLVPLTQSTATAPIPATHPQTANSGQWQVIGSRSDTSAGTSPVPAQQQTASDYDRDTTAAGSGSYPSAVTVWQNRFPRARR